MDAVRPHCHLQPPRLSGSLTAPGAVDPRPPPPPSACSRRLPPVCPSVLFLLGPTVPPQWTPPPQPAGRRRGRQGAAAAGGLRVVGRRWVPPASRRSRGCPRRRSRWRRSCGTLPSGSRCPTGGYQGGRGQLRAPSVSLLGASLPGTGRSRLGTWQAVSGGAATGQRREGSTLKTGWAFSSSRSLKEVLTLTPPPTPERHSVKPVTGY